MSEIEFVVQDVINYTHFQTFVLYDAQYNNRFWVNGPTEVTYEPGDTLVLKKKEPESGY